MYDLVTVFEYAYCSGEERVSFDEFVIIGKQSLSITRSSEERDRLQQQRDTPSRLRSLAGCATIVEESG